MKFHKLEQGTHCTAYGKLSRSLNTHEIQTLESRRESLRWFLQTHLTLSEQKYIPHMAQTALDIEIQEVLFKIPLSAERYRKLLSAWTCKRPEILPIVCPDTIVRLGPLGHCHFAPLAIQLLGGSRSILENPSVAVVGSRHPTMGGRLAAKHLVESLVTAGVTIVSGGAIGIDTIALQTAVDMGGSPVCVLGSGLEMLYPKGNLELFRRIRQSGGLLVSQFAPGLGAQKWTFPLRNRTIALLADFLLVVEARLTSGSLITAAAALEMSKDIGAVPGPIDQDNNAGSNMLLKNGAFVVTGVQDILPLLGLKYSSL